MNHLRSIVAGFDGSGESRAALSPRRRSRSRCPLLIVPRGVENPLGSGRLSVMTAQ